MSCADICVILKLPFVPTHFGDCHILAWMCFQNSSLQQVSLPGVSCASGQILCFLTFPLEQFTCLVPLRGGPTFHLLRAPDWKIEEALFARKASHFYVADTISW